MTCDWRHCDDPATTALRFGDGRSLHDRRLRQTFARYCPTHLGEVHRLFVTCDERPLAELEAGKAGGGIRMRR